MRKERGFYSNAVQSGRMAGSRLKAYRLLETEETQLPPARSKLKTVSRVPSLI